MASNFDNNNSEESINFVPRWYPPVRLFLSKIKRKLMEKIHLIEQIFVNKYYTAYSISCQLFFFTLCNLHLENYQPIKDFRRHRMLIGSLTAILLYSIAAYFVYKIRAIWRGYRRRTATTSRSFAFQWKAFCKIILEWAKAAILILYLKEEGLEFEQNLLYCLITFSYFLCTEKGFLEIFPELIEALQIDSLDNLEYLYVPLFMNLFAIAAGFTIDIYSFIVKITSRTFISISFFFMVYLRIKDVYYNYWKILVFERETYLNCRMASKREIEDWDDICAICLNRMSKARITPCKHLFHPHCLKLSLRRSFNCPLCKYCFLNKLL